MDLYRQAIAEVAAGAGLPQDEVAKAVAVPRERQRADLTLACFPWAKALRKAPAKIAAEVAAAFEGHALLDSAQAAGPFVNFRIERTGFTSATLEGVGPDSGRSDRGSQKTVVIDYGSPNIAKPLLFHHLRSAVIGQALCNLHRWRGYTVVGLNFLGDVGTAFGKLMVGIQEFGEADDAQTLKERYVAAAQLCEREPERMEQARRWAKRLEEDEAEAHRLWERARRISLEGFAQVYDALGIRHDVVDGEQMYVRRARQYVDQLLTEKKATRSEGAVVVETDQGAFMLRKRDGATLYGTRDLVAALDRWERYRFERCLYVVDVAQQHHFKLLFASLRAIGEGWAGRCRHVAFGQVLMGGQRAGTRKGSKILLHDVLEEGVRRAGAIIEEKNADLKDKQAVARAVGVGAVIFSDVGFPVRKEIHFDWDEILSFDGRTGPYLQYVHASACSILRKGAADAQATCNLSLLTDEREWNLVRRLAECDDAVERACEECEPSHLSSYLYDLAREFRGYHTAGAQDAALRVLVDDPALRTARLKLVACVRQVLAIGLRLLGLEPVEEM